MNNSIDRFWGHDQPVDLFKPATTAQEAEERREIASGVGEELTQYANSLPRTKDHYVLHTSLLLLQRRFFLLANRLSFAELESLHEAYRIAYRDLEDLLYEMDIQRPTEAQPAAKEEPQDYTELFQDPEDGTPSS
jgi:hypothetical protein